MSKNESAEKATLLVLAYRIAEKQHQTDEWLDLILGSTDAPQSTEPGTGTIDHLEWRLIEASDNAASICARVENLERIIGRIVSED